MNCVDCQERLAEYALDALAPGEAQQVAEHLTSGCTDCRQHLSELRAAWASLAGTLQPVSPPPQLKAELFARIRKASEPVPDQQERNLNSELEPVHVPQANGRGQRRWRWQSALPYIAATLSGIAIGFWFARSPAIDAALIDRYHAQLLHAERTFGTPRMRFAALHTSEDQQRVQGTLIWDSAAAELHAYAFDLGPPPDGSVYRLWFVADDNSWIPVGDLAVGPGGVCSAVIDIPASARLSSRVVVTTEPASGANAGAEQHGPIGFRGEFSE